MKLLTKMTVLALSLSSAFAHAVTAQYKDCREVEGGKNCMSFQMTAPDYPYPWLNDFIMQETFEREDAKPASLEKLTQEYVKEILNELEESGDNSEKVVWGEMEEAGDYLQVAKHDALKLAEDNIEDSSYYVFNKKSPSQEIFFDDILMSPEAEKPLAVVLKTAYLTWLKNRNASEADIKAIFSNALEDGEMVISDNWFFAKDHLVFHYGVGEISPPDYGSLSLAIPTQALEGIIQPDILKAAQAWKVPFPAK